MRAIVDEHKMDKGAITEKTIDFMIETLQTKRNLTHEELCYLKELIQRAVDFDIDTLVFASAEPHTQNNSTLLQDVFNVHRWFLFNDYHFEKYSKDHCRRDVMSTCCQQYLPELNKSDIQLNESFNFHHSYLIFDDIFQIFDLVFDVSRFVDNVFTNKKHDRGKKLQIDLIIIPNAVKCIYGDQIVFEHGTGTVEEYLAEKDIFDYSRKTIKTEKILEDLQYLHNCNGMEMNKLMIVIDRRKFKNKKTILYMVPCNISDEFYKMKRNYFLGFEFIINTIHGGNNMVKAYLRYGVNEKIRFYPEFLTSLIPKIFAKPEDMSEADYLLKLYSSQFKHGWCVDLNDEIFNKVYKIITGFDHRSVNYNRAIVHRDVNDHIILFLDLLDTELQTNENLDPNDVDVLYQFLYSNEYDSASMIDDIIETELEQSNIGNYFTDHNLSGDLMTTIRQFIRKFTHCPSNEEKQTCKVENILDLYNHVAPIIHSLSADTQAHEIDLNKATESFDHLVSIHFSTKEIYKHIITYIVGDCKNVNCEILNQHVMRKREHSNIISKNDDSDSISEIRNATVNSLHSYIMHDTNELYRLEQSNSSSHFVSTENNDDPAPIPNAAPLPGGTPPAPAQLVLAPLPGSKAP
eukprot:45552_1